MLFKFITKISEGRSQRMSRLIYSLLITLVIVAITTPIVIALWDPYQIIGVKKDAKLHEIKRAYRELSRKLHPDKSSDDEANKKFIELNKAYDILKDPGKRSRHDRKTNRQLSHRILWRSVENVKRIIFYMSYTESFTTIILLAIFASLLFYKNPTDSIPQSQTSSSKPKETAEESIYDNKQYTNIPSFEYKSLKLIELKAETYNGMVRLLKPGYRSIIILIDSDTREKLLPNFKKSVWPYRRNKTLLFGYLCLDRNLNWYKTLLQQVTGIEELNVNKKNCNGTVLSLNGFKKYLRVYHATHHEVDCSYDRLEEEESFLGFNDDDDDVERGKKSRADLSNHLHEVDKLLDKLPIWLDKMFDGLTKRYFVDEWPEEIN